MIYQNKWYQQQLKDVVEEMNKDRDTVAASPGKSRFVYIWTLHASRITSHARYTLGEAKDYLRALYF